MTVASPAAPWRPVVAAPADASRIGVIQALRGWAVTAVCLFHFGVPGFDRGHLGVDMFFVISGYLMAERVIDPVFAGQFSMRAFWLARARRTLPALLALVVVLIAAGWWLMPPLDFRRLAKHSTASLSLLSNWVYQSEGGYFDIDATDKFLLHTWSLSIEWQFYLMFPLAVAACARLRPAPRWLWFMLGLVALLSLAQFLIACNHGCRAAHFDLRSRLWQPLAGVLAFGVTRRLCLHRRAGPWLMGLSLALLCSSVIAVGPADQLPATVWSVAVVIGAAALIVAGARSTWQPPAPVAAIGDASFGIYLWHWPIVVALHQIARHNQAEWVAGSLAIAVVMGLVSHRLVERPARDALRLLSPTRQVLTVVASLALGAAGGVLVYGSQGFPKRVPAEVQAVEAESHNTNPRRAECFQSADASLRDAPCVHAPTQAPGVLLIGDSHADAVFSALAVAADRRGRGFLYLGYSGCPPLPGARRLDRPENNCDEFYRQARRVVLSLAHDVPVLLVARWTVYLQGYLDGRVLEQPWVRFDADTDALPEVRHQAYLRVLGETLCLWAHERPVYVLGPIPEMPFSVPRQAARAAMFPSSVMVPGTPLQRYLDRHRSVLDVLLQSQACGVHLLDPAVELCKGGICAATDNGRPLYYDDNHLSEFGNRRLVPILEQVFLR